MSHEPDPPPRRHARQPPASTPAGSRSLPVGGPRRRCDIALQNPCRYPEASARAWRPWLGTVVGTLAPQADSLAVRFVSDLEMRRLNRIYRHHDRSTDVLSFRGNARSGNAEPDDSDAEGPFPAPASHLGDIAVSVPTARRQASELGHSVEEELRILLLHGILHCLGYDHETDGGTMSRLERRWRAVFVDRDRAETGGREAGEDDL